MEKRFSVLLCEDMHEAGVNLLKEKCNVKFPESLEEDDLVREVADVDAVVIRARGAITRRVIEAAPRLKVIGRHGVGLDNIDLEAAREKGIRVVYTPLANAQSVAEHFVGLALVLAKKINHAFEALKQGHWNARYEIRTTELQGKTLGVVGFGNIGQCTARICHFGFEMPVLYFDVEPKEDAEKLMNARRVSLEELFSQSDIISINLPLLPETRHLIDRKFFTMMKPTAFVINMARGPVWKEEDLIEVLKERRIAGAAADVFEQEPLPADHPLLKLDNFVGTPHMAAHTEEGMYRMSMVAEDVIAVLEGREPRFPAV
ncbi:hydroxyacid dehydrogenase [Thermodesulforhabdus norvegica]|uniref:D-3-phosphoglycerate dehydrogenase n=1 Tax=Thermodesulforhabdus norvegica TaxID=39841 RepID=A0A1I4R2J3_9BACT|nr:hydroxyacid dehydrogenase [Thermodesulforhabdus norvegica]SFM46489.1 D-3-phosphoglycerate dehydrogenase [Thermodesulforhabdus norvegica]